MELIKIPVRRIGYRPNLFMGGDRELVMVAALFAATLIITTFEITPIIFGLILWFGSLYSFRLAAKVDPMMRTVYLRSLKYKSYYPARSMPFRNNQNLRN